MNKLLYNIEYLMIDADITLAIYELDKLPDVIEWDKLSNEEVVTIGKKHE